MPYKNPNDEKNYQKKYQKEWYKRNKAKHISSLSKSKKIRKALAYEFVNSYKEKLGCSQCPENHVSCLEFHHKDEKKKDFEVSAAIRDGYGLDRIKKEIEKCIVLCSNCHKKFHWNKKRVKQAKVCLTHFNQSNVHG